jgi:galactose oxidase
MFCPGTSTLADGQMLITGGITGVRSTLYNPWNNTWTSAANMTVERGYQSQLTLSNGKVFVLGGSWSGEVGRKYGEVYDHSSRTWTRKPGTEPKGEILTNDVEGSYRTDNHMWLFEATDGRILHAGPAKRMHWINLTENGSIIPSMYGLFRVSSHFAAVSSLGWNFVLTLFRLFDAECVATTEML